MRIGLIHEQDLGGVINRTGKVDLLLTLGRNRETRGNQINVAGHDGRNQAVEPHRGEFDLIAHVLRRGADQVNIVTDQLLRTAVNKFERLEDRLRTDIQHREGES